MIATVQEFKDAKAIFEEEKAALVEKGVEVAMNYRFLIMT